jgi:hypothetical protein
MNDETINWISAAGHLPETDHAVLTLSKNRWVRVGIRHRECSWLSVPGRWPLGLITHWAELPKGPSSARPVSPLGQ